MKKHLLFGIVALALMSSCSTKTESDNQAVTTPQASTQAIPQDQENSVKGSWTIQEIALTEGNKIVPAGIQSVTFTDNTYSFSTNCNSIAGDYTLSGDSLTLMPGLMTEMACDDMTVEDALRTLIPAVNTVSAQADSVLRLSTSDSDVYILLRSVQK